MSPYVEDGARDGELCVCGHERWEHSIMATQFVDVGCTHVIIPDNERLMPFECHCSQYRRADVQP